MCGLVSAAGKIATCQRKLRPTCRTTRRSGRGDRLDDADMQVLELLGLHFRRRAHHQILRALVLGERDHLTNAVLVGEHADHPVDTWSDAAVRWRAVLEGAQ